MLQHHEQPRMPRLQQHKLAECPAPLGRHREAPWDQSAPCTLELPEQGSAQPPPTAKTEHPPDPHTPAAICASTDCCHLEHRTEVPEGKLPLPRAASRRARQPRGRRARCPVNWVEPGWSTHKTAGNMGTCSRSCSRSRGSQADGNAGGGEQRQKTKAKGTTKGREERGRGQDWPPGALDQETRFTPALLLTPQPVSIREGQGLQGSANPPGEGDLYCPGATSKGDAAAPPARGTTAELMPGATNSPSGQRAQELKSLLCGQVHHLSERLFWAGKWKSEAVIENLPTAPSSLRRITSEQPKSLGAKRSQPRHQC